MSRSTRWECWLCCEWWASGRWVDSHGPFNAFVHLVSHAPLWLCSHGILKALINITFCRCHETSWGEYRVSFKQRSSSLSASSYKRHRNLSILWIWPQMDKYIELHTLLYTSWALPMGREGLVVWFIRGVWLIYVQRVWWAQWIGMLIVVCFSSAKVCEVLHAKHPRLWDAVLPGPAVHQHVQWRAYQICNRHVWV